MIVPPLSWSHGRVFILCPSLPLPILLHRGWGCSSASGWGSGSQRPVQVGIYPILDGVPDTEVWGPPLQGTPSLLPSHNT